MSDSGSFGFKPRARGMIIGGIPWLARISDFTALVADSANDVAVIEPMKSHLQAKGLDS